MALNPDPSRLSLSKTSKSQPSFLCDIMCTPGGLIQGLRVTLMYISSLAKGTDSDNARHSGPDSSLSHQMRSLTL